MARYLQLIAIELLIFQASFKIQDFNPKTIKCPISVNDDIFNLFHNNACDAYSKSLNP